ncbi:MAG: hypothetical protein GW854_13670 [Erythrobacter sp.]|nr:hypothetical protein [Erythrobacter sp.]NCQ22414.1 hypothetical protein [Sphingomonadales bacterium]
MIRNWQKLGLASLLAVPLAAVSGAHALSSASVRNAPDLAIALFPLNGLAKEKIAYQMVAGNVRLPGGASGSDEGPAVSGEANQTQRYEVGAAELARFATEASEAARDALRLEPLSPRAHTILALSLNDPERRRTMVALSSRLNRRDLPLQGLVLEQKLASNDYEGSMETLDQILRVHPERQAEFFPLLVAALAQDATVPSFTELLSKPLPWRDAFLLSAVKTQTVQANLAAVRARIDIDNTAFDKHLIAGLANSGNIEDAERIYRRVSGSAPTGSSPWASDYPPFDWELANRAGFRAQRSLGEEELEIDVAPGNGGVIASRLIMAVQQPFFLRLSHNIESASQREDVKVSLRCWGQTAAFFERSLTDADSLFRVSDTPPCPYFVLSLSARSWTGAQPIAGAIRSVTLSTR